jgi:hypothetical protein
VKSLETGSGKSEYFYEYPTFEPKLLNQNDLHIR